ncbi:MAG TPA: prepilin-type N-terminal cleavage/methylation domain-containing protein [Sandaracinaceae bacterium]
MKRKVLGAFTLLEVMVAVAILAVAMTAIFSSEGGAIRAGARARQMTTATLLARCKMAEVEEQMAREGFPAVVAEGDDACCEGGEQEGFTCHWQVEQVMLPDAIGTGAEDPLAAVTAANGSRTDDGAAAVDIENAVAGGLRGDVIGSIAMQYAYPIIRPMIESQVRRATVSVRWQEGTGTRNARGPCEEGERSCFTVVQYLVADQGAASPEGAVSEEEGSGGARDASRQGGGSTPRGGANR